MFTTRNLSSMNGMAGETDFALDLGRRTNDTDGTAPPLNILDAVRRVGDGLEYTHPSPPDPGGSGATVTAPNGRDLTPPVVPPDDNVNGGPPHRLQKLVDWCGERITEQEKNNRIMALVASPCPSGWQYEENPPGSNCWECGEIPNGGPPPNGGPIDPVDPDGGNGDSITGPEPQTWDDRTPTPDESLSFEGGDTTTYTGDEYDPGLTPTNGNGNGGYTGTGILDFLQSNEKNTGLPWWLLLVSAGATAYVLLRKKKKAGEGVA